jgi:coenzyme F420-reducing hydrogenase delta subunit
MLAAALRTAFERSEDFLDAFFGGADNPLRHLGALGLYFLWILVASGLYLYTVLDTSIEGVYSSIGWLSREQWYLGGVLRSLHRYASDAFVLVMMLHLVREWAYGRYRGFRLYSWVTGVPLIWLAYISGIGGYWIVWDRLAQFSAIATTELLDWLPIFSEPAARNFLAPDSVNDRFFTVLVFIHIGVPLMLILGLWAHVNRISRVDYLPSRRAMAATMASLLVLALVKPALSDAPAEPGAGAGRPAPRLVHPVPPSADRHQFAGGGMDADLRRHDPALRPALPAAPGGGADRRGRCARTATVAAAATPTAPTRPSPWRRIPDKPGAQDRRGRCRPLRRLRHLRRLLPVLDPFRSQERWSPASTCRNSRSTLLRRQLEAQVARCPASTRLVVFGCDKGADVAALDAADTATLSLICTGMLPPSFVEYALRSGADGVVVTGCRDGGCEFRLGMEWTRERLTRNREPHLRDLVPLDRVQLVEASRSDAGKLAAAISAFRTRLEKDMAETTSGLPPTPEERSIMAKPAAIIGQIILYGAFAAFIGYFSTAPTYRQIPTTWPWSSCR